MSRTRLGALLLVLGLASAAGAATGGLSGTVRDTAGLPVAGAMVVALHPEQRRATTVFSDAGGRFALPPLEAAAYELRVRRLGYRELGPSDVPIGAASNGPLDLVLESETDPHELAWQLPASRWLPLLLAELSSDAHREEFLRQCTFCHQQGNWATRVPRSAEDWEKIFKLMARMGGVISPGLRAELPAAFNAAYADDSYLEKLAPAIAGPPPAPEPEALAAVITEWDLGHPASMQHDLAVHPDGSVYSVDMNQDRLYRLDPRTSERRSWPIPAGGAPLGGVFGTSRSAIAPNSNAHVGPHSLQVAPDGSIWVTLALGNKMGRFDPAAQKWEIVEQEEGLYPHTLRFDAEGRIWYTLAISNHVGMLDPRSRERAAVRLPARDWRQEVTLRVVPFFLWLRNYIALEDSAASEGVELPVPYGIDIAPDGGVWFSQLNERRIGRIDPKTRAVEMIETPFPGPRRLRFDSRGNLWIPGYSAGLVARYTPATREFRTWKLPVEGAETPYALNVDLRTDTVWICGTNSDSLIRFAPEEERFTVFPLPTRVTYTREIDFDAAGGVWASNSNFPTWQIEAPGPKVIRLQVGDGSGAERALARRGE